MNAIDMTPWREHRVAVEGIGIVLYEAGSTAPDAPTLVLVHGLGLWTQAAWDVIVPLMDPALRIVAFDLPGFGRSDKPDARYNVAFFVRVMAGIVDQVAPAAFVLCGHSLGGYIAANYAAAYPKRVERLILIAPPGFLRAVHFVYALLGSQLGRWLFTSQSGRRFVNRTINESVLNPALIAAPIRETAFALVAQAEVRRAFAAVYTGAIPDFYDVSSVHARLRRWTGPTLIVWGRYDRFMPIKALATARLVYPHADVLICEQSGHLPMVEEAPLVAIAIAQFLAA